MEKEKNELLDELAEAIRKLKEASEDVEMFVRYIYKTHPTKNQQHMLDETLLVRHKTKKF